MCGLCPLIRLKRSVDPFRFSAKALEASVDGEQAVGVAVDVVDALDVGASLGAEAAALVVRGGELAEAVGERLLRHGDDRDADAEGLLGAADRLVVEERDDGLAERHRLDREEAVPPRVQLVDDDVRALVAAAGFLVGKALDDVEGEAELAAGGDDVLGSLARAAGGSVEDEWARGVRGRCGAVRRQVEPRRHDLRLGNPADRVVGADDLRAGETAVGELGGGPAANVGAEEVEDGAAAGEAEEPELERLRDEREAEVEVEDVGARQEAGERAPLGELAAGEDAPAVERPVGVGGQPAALENDEPRGDALA